MLSSLWKRLCLLACCCEAVLLVGRQHIHRRTINVCGHAQRWTSVASLATGQLRSLPSACRRRVSFPQPVSVISPRPQPPLEGSSKPRPNPRMKSAQQQVAGCCRRILVLEALFGLRQAPLFRLSTNTLSTTFTHLTLRFKPTCAGRSAWQSTLQAIHRQAP